MEQLHCLTYLLVPYRRHQRVRFKTSVFFEYCHQTFLMHQSLFQPLQVQNWIDAHRHHFPPEPPQQFIPPGFTPPGFTPPGFTPQDSSPGSSNLVYYYAEPAGVVARPMIPHVVPAPHLVSPMKLKVVKR